MKNETGNFAVAVKTNDMAEANFKITPFVEEGERRFEVMLGEKRIGTLHKTFEYTWEWLNGNMTLSDAEEIGDKIEDYELTYGRGLK